MPTSTDVSSTSLPVSTVAPETTTAGTASTQFEEPLVLGDGSMNAPAVADRLSAVFPNVGLLLADGLACYEIAFMHWNESSVSCTVLPSPETLAAVCGPANRLADSLERGVGRLTYWVRSAELAAAAAAQTEATSGARFTQGADGQFREGGQSAAEIFLLGAANEVFQAFTDGTPDSVRAYPFANSAAEIAAACGQSLAAPDNAYMNSPAEALSWMTEPSPSDSLFDDPLYPALPLGPGSKGPAVAALQERLMALGYSVGPDGADGSFGPRTADAVAAFQRDDALEMTGIVDDVTLSWIQFREVCFTCMRD